MANGNFSYSTYNNASDTYSGNGRSTTRAVSPEEMADIIGVSVGELTGAPTTPATIRPPYAGPTDLDRISAGLLGDAQTQSGGIADAQTQFDTSPQDMLGRIMSEKDNMDLDFNGNGSVTPEDARVYAQQHAEQQTTTSATTSGGLGDAQTEFDSSPQDMFGRIMSEKDNMELDFNGNGSVTPEDARVYAMQHAENTAREALNIAVGNAPYDERFDQNNDGKITTEEARNIASGEFVPAVNIPSVDFGSDSNVTSPNPNNFNYNEGFESGEGNTIGTNDKGVLSKNLLPGGGFEYQFIDHSGKVVENFGTDLDNAKGFLEGKPPTTVAPVVTADPAVDDVFDVDSVVNSVPETVAPTIPETVAPTIPDPIETVAPTVTETVADPIEEIPVAAPPQIGEEGNPGITSFGNMSAGDLQRQINRGNIAPDNVANAQARITQLENEQFTKPQGILAAPGLTPVDTTQPDVQTFDYLPMERQRQMQDLFYRRRVGGPADGQPIQQGNLGQPVMSDRDSYINQQIAPVLYQSNEDYKTGRQAAGDRYDENSSVYQPDNLSSGLGGANPNGMGGAGQGGFQFPMTGNPNQAIRDGAMNRLSGQPADTQPQQTPYAQNSGYGMTMDRHGTQSATPQPAYGAASPLSNIPSVQPQSPAYSGFDTGGYTSYNTPAVQSPYPAQSPYGG